MKTKFLVTAKVQQVVDVVLEVVASSSDEAKNLILSPNFDLNTFHDYEVSDSQSVLVKEILEVSRK